MRKVMWVCLVMGCASRAPATTPATAPTRGAEAADASADMEVTDVLEDASAEEKMEAALDAARAKCAASLGCKLRGLCDATTQRESQRGCMSLDEEASLTPEEEDALRSREGDGPPFLDCSDVPVCTPSSEGCEASKGCSEEGACAVEGMRGKPWGACVPGRPEDCAHSQACEREGLCEYQELEEDRVYRSCVVPECEECAEFGACGVVVDDATWRCEPRSDKDCEDAARCRTHGECARVESSPGQWGCDPRETAHCKNSDVCRVDGQCVYSKKSEGCEPGVVK